MHLNLAFLAFAFLFLAGTLDAAPPISALETPLTVDNLDPAAYSEWVDGATRPLGSADAKDASQKPQWVIWTDRTSTGHSGTAFGASKNPGPRHLRVGFKGAVPVGALLVRGGGKVSALKPDAAYPGDLADESQWVPAERILAGRVTRQEVKRDQYVLWTLPEVIRTRALRFTHLAEATEKDYAGHLLGAYVLPARVANVATQAIAGSRVNDKDAGRIINEQTDPGWDQWANLPLKGGERSGPVSVDSPEWLMLTWTAPVTIRSLGVVFGGFSEADVQIYDGPADRHPREAADTAWKTVKSFTGLKNRYPTALGVDWLDLGREVRTRALRLRITKAVEDGGHPHTQGHARAGQRVWLGELLVLQALGDAALKTAILPSAAASERPPIAVKFTVPEAGWVTLVIEDSAGKRVRNLLADTFFEKGDHTAWWDGSDDLGRDPSAAEHGLYYIPTQLVPAGKYRIRGLWRKQVNIKHEFGFYNAGNPPWETADKTGGWLSNHTPPSAVLFVPNVPDHGKSRPSVLIGSYVSEGTAGLAWVDLEGKKWKGQGWVGGNWTGAPYLARDEGTGAVADIYAYVASAWSVGSDTKKPPQGEIRLTGLTAKEDRPIVRHVFTPTRTAEGAVSWEAQIGGLAVHDGVAVVSLPSLNRLLLVDARVGKPLGEASLDSPHGLAFDAKGRLLALSGQRVVRFARFDRGSEPARLPAPEVVVEGLEAPFGLTLDAEQTIYVSDRGRSHQVKVYSATGKPLRVVGKAGEPGTGPYKPLHMNNPRGLTIDSRGRLWVAEEDLQPKRISVWDRAGDLVTAFYGPAEYGGGGSIDEQDRSKLYYYGMQFRLDWEKGTDQLASVFYRPGPGDLKLAFRSGLPQTALHVRSQRYWTNAFNSNPTGGHGTAFLFVDRGGVAVPVAAAGRANEWDVLKSETFAAVWPAGTDSQASQHSPKAAFFIWSDRNGDGKVQPDEVVLRKGQSGGVTVGRDLSFIVARLEGQAVRFAPKRFGAGGVPIYDLETGLEVLVDGAQNPPSSGGDQALVGPEGWTIHTNAPRPFSPSGLGGAKGGTPRWSYPSLWPGLHASHEAPVPEQPGTVIGHTRLLGDFITAGSERLWLLNGNHGPVYVFTADGLFVTQLFQDMRLGRPWLMPSGKRGMILNETTPSDENFWPSVTQTADGAIYLVTGRPNSITRVEGLDSVHRLPPADLVVSTEDLNQARDYFVKVEAARQAAQGRGELTVAMRSSAPTIDGKVEEWGNANWVDIDRRGTAAYFNSKSGAYHVTGAVAVAGDHLYAAWRTGDKDLLRNAGDAPLALFKTGGALDLMIGTDPDADPQRRKPVAGDQRLLVTQVGGKTRALLYRAVVPDTKEPIPFSSPGRTITFDRVEDVSDRIRLAGAEGNFEVAVPLALLGLKPVAGQTLRGDLGILRGTGTMTTQRVYWSNKATAIVADVPSEAELRPHLWGRWVFQSAEKKR